MQVLFLGNNDKAQIPIFDESVIINEDVLDDLMRVCNDLTYVQ